MTARRDRTHLSPPRAASAWALRLVLVSLAVAGTHAIGAASSPAPPERAVRPDAAAGERADTTDVVDQVSPVSLALRVGGNTLRVPYYANRSLGVVHPGVTRAVVVLHGTLRNAVEYQASMEDAAAQSGGAGSTTFILTPQFLTEPDVDRFHLSDEHAFWAYLGWRKGDLSISTVQNPRPARISSFAVLDTILVRLAETLPDLETVVVAGHSAGGQFANLWSASSHVHHEIEGARGIPIRAIVSNPSSYLYFNEERWVPASADSFSVPDPSVIADCPDYNDYKYGVENPNEYAAIGSDSLRAHYSGRAVVYLLGGADTNPYDYYLDRTCPALLQGSQRLERGTVYASFLTHFFGSEIWSRQSLAVVPGVGHDHALMFASDCGRYHIFDYGSCDPTPPVATWEDVTPQLLEGVTCHAAAWGDHDADGDPDLFLASTDAWDGLARNDGGVFVDATHPPLPDPGRAMAAHWGDFDNDGRADLYVVHWQGTNRLFRNEGNDLFSDATAGAIGLSGDCVDAAWADIENDGDLDLFVTRTSNQGCRLLRNDGGAFVDATVPPLDVAGTTRCPAWGDYDDDGDLDLFLARGGPDRLFRNDGGTFVDVTSGPLGDNGDGSSAAWGDYDNDGDLDLYIVNRMSPCRLLRNDGGSFVSVTQTPVGVSGPGRSASWADYDNDGWLDLYLCNDGQPNRLFRNLSGGGFESVTDTPVNFWSASFGGSWADYDGDGDLDLYVATNNAPNRLFRNNAASGRHWFQVTLLGTESNASAIGARVRVLAGGLWQTRQVGGDSGYTAESARTVAFGLGEAALLDSLVVAWPSGIVQRMGGLLPDWRMTLIESTEPMDTSGSGSAGWRLAAAPNPFREGTRLSLIAPTPNGPRSERLALTIVDAAGRKVRELVSEGDGQAAPPIWWDGRDSRGGRVAAGVYRALPARASGGAVTIVRVR